MGARGVESRNLVASPPLIVPALLALSSLIACVPFGDLRVLGRPLGWIVGSLLRIRRDHVETAMTRARIRGSSDVALEMYASLGALVMELLWLAGAPRRDLRPVVRVDPASARLLDEVLGSGRGAVFGASHTGNWELAACAMAQRTRFSVLVKPVSLGVFDRFMKQMRKRYGVGLLEGPGAIAEARRELDAGRVVAVLVDQVPPREDFADRVPFLGADALTDRAAAGLAASAGVPLVLTASRRAEDGTQVLHVLSVREPPPRGRTEWAREATRQVTEELAAFVAEAPDQWLWMHRRWKRLPGAV